MGSGHKGNIYLHACKFSCFFCFVMLCMDVLCILYASVLYLENFGSQCISLDTQKISPKNWAVLYQKVLFLQGRQSHFFWVKFIKMVGILNAYLWVKYNMAKEKHRVFMKKKKKKNAKVTKILPSFWTCNSLNPFIWGSKLSISIQNSYWGDRLSSKFHLLIISVEQKYTN